MQLFVTAYRPHFGRPFKITEGYRDGDEPDRTERTRRLAQNKP